MGADIGRLKSGNVIKQKSQGGKSPSADSQTGQSMPKGSSIAKSSQKSGSFGVDSFSTSYDVPSSRPAKTGV